jgi:hypothetical protein
MKVYNIYQFVTANGVDYRVGGEVGKPRPCLP